MRSRLSLIAAVVALVASCYYGDPGVIVNASPAYNSVIGINADPDHPADTYTVTGTLAETVVTAAPANGGTNTRTGLLVENGDQAVNAVCATWDSYTGTVTQPGAILHFNGTEFLTVTQNIYGGARWVMNVMHWDLSRSGARFDLIAQHTPPSIPPGTPWPIRMCAEANGNQVRFKVWPATWWGEPAWGDPCCTRQTTVGYAASGRAGLFAGHLEPGGELRYTSVSIN